MKVYSLPDHVVITKRTATGLMEFHLAEDFEKWLFEKIDSVTLTGGGYPVLLIKDEYVEVEFKLLWSV